MTEFVVNKKTLVKKLLLDFEFGFDLFMRIMTFLDFKGGLSHTKDSKHRFLTLKILIA